MAASEGGWQASHREPAHHQSAHAPCRGRTFCAGTRTSAAAKKHGDATTVSQLVQPPRTTTNTTGRW